MQHDSVFDYLALKGAEYRAIDIHRFPRIFKKISHKIQQPKIIHIIGTNGKGSTGRTIAYYLWQQGYKTLHFSSPHIFEVNERIWIDGESIRDEKFQTLHEDAKTLLSSEDIESLSYFEYITLLMLIALKDVSYGVIEAGLGGEFDATNVLNKTLSVITPIGLDHQEFLGKDIQSITITKTNSIQNPAITAEQTFEVQKIVEEKIEKLYTIETLMSQEEIASIYKKFALNFPQFLIHNIVLGVTVIKYFESKIDLKYLKNIEFFGRFYPYKKNIIIDVGHNEQAANAIVEALGKKKVNLIYNTYSDKDYKKILTILKPVVIRLLIINIKNDRILPTKVLEEGVSELGIEYEYFEICEDDQDYLVFGSFSVVEGFLRFDKR